MKLNDYFELQRGIEGAAETLGRLRSIDKAANADIIHAVVKLNEAHSALAKLLVGDATVLHKTQGDQDRRDRFIAAVAAGMLASSGTKWKAEDVIRMADELLSAITGK